MPPLRCEYLSRVFFEVGPTLLGGMGPVPLTQTELGWFQHNTGIDLSTWEIRVLRRLSNEWIAESQRAEKWDCPAPWVDPESDEFRRDVLPDRIKLVLRG